MKFAKLFLLVFFCILPFPVKAQLYQSLEYSYDSTGNRTRRDSVGYIPQPIREPSRQLDTALQEITAFPSSTRELLDDAADSFSPSDTISGRLYFTEAEKRSHAEERRRNWEAYLANLNKEDDCRGRNSLSYAVGAIPCQEGLTPSGGRTYSIPIPTAPGLKFVPSVAIGYNSQAGEGWAGFGWDIQGISSIQLISRNNYYHSETRGANAYDPDPVFALDGVPLVTNTQSATSANYPLITARGNILAAPKYEGTSVIQGFYVLYPNGVTAEYGITTEATSLTPSYPLSEMWDIEGNHIVFDYLEDETGNGNHRLDAIHYGSFQNGQFAGTILFTYSTTTGSPPRYYAGKEIRRDYYLTGVESRNGNALLARYTLSYTITDRVRQLTGVACTNDTTSLRPLQFAYGATTSNPSDGVLVRKDSLLLEDTYTSAPPIYRRGKFISASYNDGLLIYPEYENYGALWTNVFGSKYPTDKPILLAPKLQPNSSINDSVLTGYGFQTVDAVDVDGDGLDEIVKVNFNGASETCSHLSISIYKCQSTGIPDLIDQFTVQLQGVITIGSNHSPYRRAYFWGDFLGNGKAQLLCVAYNRNLPRYPSYSQTSYTSLIDLSTHSVLCDSELFSFPLDKQKCLLALDLDNDSQTELCYATASGLTVYRYHPSQGFVLESTHTAITADILSSATRPYYVTDLNGDGYVDILRAPETGSGSAWDWYAFDGTGFRVSTAVLSSRSSGDEFFFIDVNRDGLADLVKANGTELGAQRNINARAFLPYLAAPEPITNTKGIVPANVVGQLSMSNFIKVDGFNVYTYGYSYETPRLRQVIKTTDSFGKLSINHYDYLPEHSRDWTDSTLTVNNLDGFAFRTLPIYVLGEEASNLTGLESDQNWFKNNLYEYYDGVVHNLGLGFQGFSKVRVQDVLDSMADITDEVHDPQKMGVVTAVEKRKGTATGLPYSSVVNTYDNHTTTYGKLNPRLIQSVAADTLTHVNVTTAYTYDYYDFPLTVNISRRIGNGTAKTENTTYTYSHNVNTSKYILGTVTQKDVLKEGDGDASSSWREVVLTTYDTSFRPLTQSSFAGARPNVRPPGTGDLPPLGTSLVSRTRWCYDTHGNVISEKTAPYNAAVFTGDTLSFDSAGRYLLSKTDALGHTTTYAGYNKFGKPLSATDYRGRTTSFYYDDWGNLVRTVYPDNTAEQSAKVWGGDGLYTVTNTATGKPDQVAHYDALGREIKTGVKRFNGQWQWQNKEYDTKGRIKRVSLPYRGASPTYWNTYHYDYYDRPDTLREASGRLTTWSYSGTSTTTIQEGIASTKTVDTNGNLISAADPGGTITYNLRDDGQPNTVSAPGGIQTRITYDRFGNRCQIEDPSAGVQKDTIVWNADGTSTHTHTNAKGSISTHLDLYGRTILVERPEYNTTYTYDTNGRLGAEQSTNGTGTTYTYDALDRLSETVESVPDGKWLKKKYFYGTGSVLDSVLFVSQTDTITTERYNYANGHPTGVTLSDGTVVWSLVSENDLGKPTQITSGTINRTYGYTPYGFPSSRFMNNGNLQEFLYSFDPSTGNLRQRNDEGQGTVERFSYDRLNRLMIWWTSPEEVFFEYGANGNPTFRDDTGYTLYQDTAHPYRATGMSIEYPNLARGRSQHITYTSYDRPSLLSEGGRQAAFTYNADYDRVRMQVRDSVNNVTLLTRYYMGGRYEIDIAGNSTKERFYLGGDAYSAPMVYVREGGSNGTWTAYNIGRDYLGSITHIATASGSLVAEYSYDPWGRLRDPETLAIYPVGQEPELFLGRGFTGHEHLPWFGLINMNARLYDPLLGRFLSPDPYVQAPDFTQSLNRYSYALNNPLKYTDESGEFAITTMLLIGGISALVFGAVNLAAHAIRGDNLGDWAWAKYFFYGAAAGFIVGAAAYSGWMGLEALSKLGGLWGGIGTAGKWTSIGVEGLHATTTVASFIGGAITHGWEGVANAGKILLGNFYLAEKGPFWHIIAQGVLRHTWESLQTGVGYDYTQLKNTIGQVDRVDYMAGATFATQEHFQGGNQGVSLGNYCNLDITDEVGTGSFDDYVITHPIYMHEYGHTIDGRRLGPAYLFTVGIPSVKSAANNHEIPGKLAGSHSYMSYEMQANILAKDYFGEHYGVSWNTPYRGADYEAWYPTHL